MDLLVRRRLRTMDVSGRGDGGRTEDARTVGCGPRVALWTLDALGDTIAPRPWRENGLGETQEF